MSINISVYVIGTVVFLFVIALAIIARQKWELEEVRDLLRFEQKFYEYDLEWERKVNRELSEMLNQKEKTILKLKAENKRLRDFCNKSDEIRQQLVRERDENGKA